MGWNPRELIKKIRGIRATLTTVMIDSSERMTKRGKLMNFLEAIV